MGAVLAAVAVLMLLTWAISIVIRDVSIVDLVWGLGFVISGWVAYLSCDNAAGSAGKLLLACVTIWGLRLSGYLTRRNLGHGEDQRYAAMRRKRPDTFWIRSLLSVFAVQAVVMLIVGLPVTLGVRRDSGTIGAFALAGAALWLVGVFFEAVGDAQLAAFKADPASQGQVMDRGLWRYTRHPNYFGDFAMWWGLWLIAVDCEAPLWSIAGPLLMSYFLLRVSGVAMLERTITSRRPGYEDYIRRTSAFFPRPPRN
jgi:steroid 5-alpha reductase family enzyme